MKSPGFHFLVLATSLSFSACGKDDGPKRQAAPANESAPFPNEADAIGTTSPEAAPGEASAAAPGPTVTMTVDASSKDLAVWSYLDLDTGTLASSAKPGDDQTWDLAFQRFRIKSNGGVSGSGGASVAIVEGGFASVTEAPTDGYVTDAADGADEGEDPDFAFLQNGGWYDYDGATHALKPKNRAFVLRTGKGQHFRIAFTAYYNAAGSPGHITLQWSTLP